MNLGHGGELVELVLLEFVFSFQLFHSSKLVLLTVDVSVGMRVTSIELCLTYAVYCQAVVREVLLILFNKRLIVFMLTLFLSDFRIVMTGHVSLCVPATF